MRKICLAALWLFSALGVKSQEKDTLTLEDRIQNLEIKSATHSSFLEQLNKLKITGFIQAQFQVAQNEGISSFEGGNFAANVDKRLFVRRGRVKFAYDGNMTKYVLQVDVTEKGVNIKDAYVRFTEPWTKWISLQAGVHDRPFGFEVQNADVLRESPDRGRMSQILFPNEKDMGAKIEINPVASSPLHIFKLEAGLYNGIGTVSTSTGTGPDFDKFKDFIGRLSFAKANKNETVKYSGGISYYSGGFRPGNDTLYQMGTVVSGDKGFVIGNTHLLSSKAKRQHFGIDGQVSFDNPIGITTLRGEYIAGKQSGSSSSTAPPTTQPTGYAYLRNFNGGYFYLVQALGTSKNSIVVKYDFYNPNKDATQAKVGLAGTKTGTADIKYQTWGFGWLYKWDENIRLTAYYAVVKNSATNYISSSDLTKNFTRDIKDNVFTLQVQYKF